MKGKLPKNFDVFCGTNRKGAGKWHTCAGCKCEFQAPEHKTKYCSKKCWLTNKPRIFKKRPGNSGENHHNWQGGISSENIRIRNSIEYKQWRHTVLVRDNNACIECSAKDNLRVDHIKPFYLYPELRFDVDNGRTLCKNCDSEIGYCYFSQHNPNAKLKYKDKELIKMHRSEGLPVKLLAFAFEVCDATIYKVLKKQKEAA